MGKYTNIDGFFMVDVPDTNVVLGFQWLYYIGSYTTNQRSMEMKFTDSKNGKNVVLSTMHQYPPKIVPSNSMEVVLQSGEIEWEVEFFITDNKQSE